MGNSDRRGPDIYDEWLETSDVDPNNGKPLRVAVIGAGVAGLGEARSGDGKIKRAWSLSLLVYSSIYLIQNIFRWGLLDDFIGCTPLLLLCVLSVLRYCPVVAL